MAGAGVSRFGSFGARLGSQGGFRFRDTLFDVPNESGFFCNSKRAFLYRDESLGQSHIVELKEGAARVRDLSAQLDQTKGKAERGKIKTELQKEIDQVKGHEKELCQKPKVKKEKDQGGKCGDGGNVGTDGTYPGFLTSEPTEKLVNVPSVPTFPRGAASDTFTLTKLADGSVKITTEVTGRAGGRAVYEKVIDAAGQTTSVVQKAYDASGALTHVDPKFP